MPGRVRSEAAIAPPLLMIDPVAAMARRGAPWTFDAAALALRLQALRDAGVGTSSHTVCWPAFEHVTGDPVEGAISVAPTVSIALVEGLYLLHRGEGWDLANLFDECWFLDASLPVAMERLALRHMATPGVDRPRALARIAGNDRLNAELVLRSRTRADWLVPDQAT